MASDFDLRFGDYRTALADCEFDAVITDPPYGERTHSGHDRVLRYVGGDEKQLPDQSDRSQLVYDAWTDDDVRDFCEFMVPRCRGWIVALTSHDLWRSYEAHLTRLGRYVFHPIPCVIRGMTVRISGDGPGSWAVWACVARPKNMEFMRWGSLPGAYYCKRGSVSSKDFPSMIGGKPLRLMNDLVADYSRPGDLVCDPCSGMATTARAAIQLGRRFVGAEINEERFREANTAFLSDSHQLGMFQ